MQYDKRKNIKVLWYLIPLLMMSFIFSVIILNKKTISIYEEYPLIKCNDKVFAIISKASVFKGTTLLEDDKGKIFSIRAFNWDIKPNVLYYHLEAGDSIARQPNSDTLYLYQKKDGNVIKFEVQCFE